MFLTTLLLPLLLLAVFNANNHPSYCHGLAAASVKGGANKNGKARFITNKMCPFGKSQTNAKIPSVAMPHISDWPKKEATGELLNL